MVLQLVLLPGGGFVIDKVLRFLDRIYILVRSSSRNKWDDHVILIRIVRKLWRSMYTMVGIF